MLMSGESCGDCKFFKRRLDLISEGQCRRYPGTVMVFPVQGKAQLACCMPNKHQDDWCGEFLRKVVLQ